MSSTYASLIILLHQGRWYKRVDMLTHLPFFVSWKNAYSLQTDHVWNCLADRKGMLSHLSTSLPHSAVGRLESRRRRGPLRQKPPPCWAQSRFWGRTRKIDTSMVQLKGSSIRGCPCNKECLICQTLLKGTASWIGHLPRIRRTYSAAWGSSSCLQYPVHSK